MPRKMQSHNGPFSKANTSVVSATAAIKDGDLLHLYVGMHHARIEGDCIWHHKKARTRFPSTRTQEDVAAAPPSRSVGMDAYA